jgi:hypothetical protein
MSDDSPHYYECLAPSEKHDNYDDSEVLTVVNNNKHPVKLVDFNGKYVGTLQAGNFFRFPASKLFRSCGPQE